MFTLTWKKYLPIIIFLMKRSAKGDQVLDMNYTDFQRATAGKKIKLNFYTIILNNGRIDFDNRNSAMATDLVQVLQDNIQSMLIMRHKKFEFSMNSNFQLTIRDTTPAFTIDASPGG